MDAGPCGQRQVCRPKEKREQSGLRFTENAARFHGPRKRYGLLPAWVTCLPWLRSPS
jgi:hypothetical protein